MYVPLSTYRLQLQAGFTLDDAADLAPYLAELGAGTCYTSPYFTATPGSTHGYDVCDHNSINAELGGPEAHARFVARLAGLGLGHMVDFVPNHMGIGTGTNAWWRDVLENGPGSPGARYFDVDWDPVKAALRAKLLLPILGDQYGRVLERGELRLEFADGLLVVKYCDNVLPTNPRLAPQVYRRATGPLTAELGADNPQLHEFLSILTSLQNLPELNGPGHDGGNDSLAVLVDPVRRREAIDERQREKEVARARLSRLVTECPSVGAHLEAAVREVNGDVGRPETFTALHEFLEAQAYRLSYWRTASHEINYRRFFDVNELAGLRVEDPHVFAATHELLGQLLKGASVQAVRIDHPDGLFDPARYFDMLQELAGGDLYLVVEKILSRHETLVGRWPVAGTTGYDYLNELNGLFINAAEAKRMRRTYAKLTGQTDSFDEVRYESKRLIMTTAMASELNVLAHALSRIAEGNRRSRDFTLNSLRDVLMEVIACFPVYRTYVDELGWTPGDRAVVDQAIVRARRRNPAMEASLFDFVREVMMPRTPETAEAGAREQEPRRNDRRAGYPPADAVEAGARLNFAMRFQQFTGPVQAKGLEDTAFFRYNLLLSLSEVGGDLERYGRRVEDFHESNAARLRQRPFEMITTATHDTKLGEDTRARINALSELTDEWSREVTRWMRMNRPHRTMVDGEPAPDRNDEYRFYQALVGVWPLEASGPDAPAPGDGVTVPPDLGDLVERLRAYMVKAVKEAKRHTSWLTPNEDYEQAVTRFVDRVLTGSGSAKFLSAIAPFARRVARVGMINGLAQVTLKVGSPGIPDFYQGSELWDLSLVDPDNRRTVDFALRRRLLSSLEDVLSLPSPERASAVAELVARWEDGRIKMLVTAVGLRLRREWPEVFLSGRYLPLVTDVTVPAGLVAFARLLDDRAALFIAPRRVAPPVSATGALPLGGEGWKTSRIILPPELHGRTFHHHVTGAEILPAAAWGDEWLFAGQIFDTVPVGIVTSTSA
jgi:(1->4)-alpha-D-glucan 1-alpha-D-glucosylmutase